MNLIKNIAFVGVGRMGANMARRLKTQGFNITAVYDARRECAQKLAAELDSTAPESLAEVTAAADVVITVVTDDAAQLDLFAVNGDSLLAGSTGKTFINCATVSPATHREIESRCEKAGAQSL